MTTPDDHPSYVKQVLGSIYVFCTLFGYSGCVGKVSTNGVVHNVLIQFFTLSSSNIEVSEN